MTKTRHALNLCAYPCTPRRLAGFGLLEVLLFVFVVGATLLVGYAWLMAKKQAAQAQAQMAQLEQANKYVDAFVAVKFRLPCPGNANGDEDCSLSKGLLPYRTLGFDGSTVQTAGGRLRYIANSTLFTEPTNLFEPSKWDVAAGAKHDYKQLSSLDYCANLTVAKTNSSSAAVRTKAGVLRPVAYAIVHPGTSDADGNGDALDGLNGGTAAIVAAPENNSVIAAYDDAVLARGVEELSLNSDCENISASINTLALAVDVVDEVNSAKGFATATAAVLTAIGGVKTAIIAAKLIKATTALGASVVTLGTASTALASAIGTCVVVVGCAEIPHAAASVAAAVIAVTASGVAVAAGLAALPAQGVYTGMMLAVTVLTGVSTRQDIDLAPMRQAALDNLNDAVVKRQAAAQNLATAQANGSSTNTAQLAAYNALYAEARDVVAATNAAGRPVGTRSIYELDPWVADTVRRINLRNEARYNELAARDELRIAQTATPVDAAVVATKQALVNNAVAAVAVADFDYPASRANLLRESKLGYCVTTTSTNSSGVVTSTTNCYVYDGSGRVAPKVDDYTAKYDAYFTKGKAISAAQKVYDDAVAIENQARASYNQLVAATPNTTPVTGNELMPWAGADAILKRADALGGMK